MEKKQGKAKFWLLCAIALALLAAVGGFRLSNAMYERKQPKITASYISGKIDSISELTTAELTYHGLIVYSEGKIPLLTQKGFSMIYTANLRAGVDISKVKVDVSEDKVTVKLPASEIQLVHVEPSSIEFYDERFALFNWTDKKDAIDAVLIAEEDARTHADTASLLERADAQTALVVRNLLSDAIGEKELVIK